MDHQASGQDIQGGLWLTPAGYKQLHAELEHLTVDKRPEIAFRIRESLQHGEFSEDNNELDEVKFEQAMVESRIAELKALFGSAQVLDPENIPTDYVGLGSKVLLEDLQYMDQFEVRVVAGIEADPNEDLISQESPMGAAIFGHSSGDAVEFMAPEGKKRYRIISISK